MRVFRKPYRDKAGKLREKKKYDVETRDHLGKIRRFPALTSRAQSEIFGRRIERLIACRAAGEPPDATLVQWLTQVPQKLKNRFVKLGILDVNKAASGKPLSEHLKDFEASIQARGVTKPYRELTRFVLRRIFNECGFKFWQDISATKIECWLINARNFNKPSDLLSGRSIGRYIRMIKAFGEWMVNTNRAIESPVRLLVRHNVGVDKRRPRRPLTIEEAQRLIAAIKTAPETVRGKRSKMPPAEWLLLIQLDIMTGLRANELTSLKVSSFDFKTNTVTVVASDSKHRREDVQSFTPEMAAKLKEHFKNKLPQAKAFNMPSAACRLKKFRQYLKLAGIPYIDADGRYLDFHSLRYTTGTFLAAAGVHPKVAQKIMRHSDINLTMSLYTHTLRGQESEAIEKLPDLMAPPAADKKASDTSA